MKLYGVLREPRFDGATLIEISQDIEKTAANVRMTADEYIELVRSANPQFKEVYCENVNREIYVVYEEYPEERLSTAALSFYANKEDALDDFNTRKDKFLYDNEWKISDEFDAEDVTDSNNCILFINKRNCLESVYVNIETVQVK